MEEENKDVKEEAFKAPDKGFGVFATDYSDKYQHTQGKKLGILVDTTNNPIQKIDAITSSGYLDIENTTTEYNAILKDKNIISGTGSNLKILSNLVKSGGKVLANCKNILNDNPSYKNKDGEYLIRLKDDKIIKVYCDMTTDDGGWTIGIFSGDGISNFDDYRNKCKNKGFLYAGRGVENKYSWLAVKRYLYNTNHILKTSGWPNGNWNLLMPIIANKNGNDNVSLFNETNEVELPDNLAGDHCDDSEELCGYWGNNGWKDNDLNTFPDPEDYAFSNSAGSAGKFISCIYR